MKRTDPTKAKDTWNDADFRAQLESLQQQMAQTIAALTRPDPKDKTIREVVGAYLTELPDQLDPHVMEDRKKCLIAFAGACGEKKISECGPLDLTHFLKSRAGWKSNATKGTKLTHIRRAFNWARSQRLISEFPFFGVKGYKGKGGRPMTDEEFRSILKNVPACFRRFLVFLRYTGCRPGEASRLRWSNINWERGIAVLYEHKTQKKTGKPRRLILTPVLMKLLYWLGHNPTAQPDCRQTARWLWRVLRDGPARATEVTKRAHAIGITLRMLYCAREFLGVKRVERWDGKPYTVYTLTKDPPAEIVKVLDQDQHIFMNERRNPWNKLSLSCLMRRLRKKKVILPGVKLYGLRHRLATEAVKTGLNLKVIASILGHEQISTTMLYVSSVGEDTSLLSKELQKVQQGLKKP